MTKQQMHKYGAISVEADVAHDEDREPRNERRSLVLAVVLTVGSLLVTLSLLFSGGSDSVANQVPLLARAPHADENQALFYKDQLVDHFDDNDDRTWANRYYQSTRHFAGPGHPIFMVVGGEGALDNGMLYPFVTEVLAKRFKAAVIQIEHRFYGPYVPIENATSEELLQLLTPHQAMSDMVHLTRHVRDVEFGCSPDHSSNNYCPIISVGGSYPGFLSALFRLVYSDFVDMAYASSAPLLMYAQGVDQDVFYDIVTSSAERASPGCAAAVKRTFVDMVEEVDSAVTLHDAAKKIGVCADTIPQYIKSQEMLSNAVILIASFAFAEYNSECYPPSPDTSMHKACALFQNKDMNTLETLDAFFHGMLVQEEKDEEGCDLATVDCDSSSTRDEKESSSCFDLMSQLPDRGPGTTLEDTGGPYLDGRMWDFQICSNIVFIIGFSPTSMFPAHEATYQHLAHHCYERFGVTPNPYELVEEWNFVDGLSSASNILFTNGMQDMWAGGSILTNISDTVLAINFENGAHHSDLSHKGPSAEDTDDIKQGYVQIADTLGGWLDQLHR